VASHTAVERALNQVQNLIERVRAAPIGGVQPSSAGMILFHEEGLGGLQLEGPLARAFRDCETVLASLQEATPEMQILSRQASRALLQGTMLRAVRPAGNPAREARATFERRLAAELRSLRKGLRAAPLE
jgi:hypothetical protein